MRARSFVHNYEGLRKTTRPDKGDPYTSSTIYEDIRITNEAQGVTHSPSSALDTHHVSRARIPPDH